MRGREEATTSGEAVERIQYNVKRKMEIPKMTDSLGVKMAVLICLS